ASKDRKEPLPGLYQSVAPHAPRRHDYQGDYSCIQAVKKTVGIWKVTQVTVKNCQHNHHQHRRQDETCDRHRGAAPAANSESNIRGNIACSRTGQSLCESKSGRKLLLRKPAALLHRERSDLCYHSKSATKSDCADFYEGKEESAECRGFGDAFDFAASITHSRTQLAGAVAYSASPLVDLSHHLGDKTNRNWPRIYANARGSEKELLYRKHNLLT